MSPSSFNPRWGGARELFQHNYGYIDGNFVAAGYGARPVINLKSDVKITEGIGTANDPFVVETN